MRYYAAMLRRLILVACLLATVACGSDSPTAPTPPPPPTPARIITVPGSRLLSVGGCSFVCSYRGEARNAGAGCAIGVTGVTRVLRGNQTVASDDWSLGIRLIRPGEEFIYRVEFDLADVQEGFLFSTTYSWTNVECL